MSQLQLSRKSILVACLLHLTTFCFSQVTEQWVKTHNGLYNREDIARDLAVDALGNVYVTGSSDDGYVTIKYDAGGNKLWIKSSGGKSLVIDAFNNVYVTGNSNEEYTTIKYSSAGDELWVKQYNSPGNGYDETADLVVDASGNVYVTGSTNINDYHSDYTTIKYDANGNELWVKSYNGPGNGLHYAHSLAVDASGNVYVTGGSDGSGTFTDYATIKYDAAGNELWVKRYNGLGNGRDEAYSLAVDASGNVYVTGYSYSSGNSNYDNLDYATLKYDAAGNELWVRTYNGPANGSDGASSLAVGG